MLEIIVKWREIDILQEFNHIFKIFPMTVMGNYFLHILPGDLLAA